MFRDVYITLSHIYHTILQKLCCSINSTQHKYIDERRESKSHIHFIHAPLKYIFSVRVI